MSKTESKQESIRYESFTRAYKYGPWAYKEVDKDGKPIPDKKCKQCFKECDYKGSFKSWRPIHVYHEAACLTAYEEMQVANSDPKEKALLDARIQAMDNDTTSTLSSSHC